MDGVAILSFVVGLAVGGGLIALLRRNAVRHACELAEARFAAEQAALEQQVRAGQQQLEQSRQANQAVVAQVEQLQTDRANLRAREAELLARGEEERKAAEAKLALLEEARQKLSDAFKALSAEALRTNNQSFLELARTMLEKYQEGAKGDLEGRQKAIGELVKPLRERLDEVNARIGELEKVRAGAYGGLTQFITALKGDQAQLLAQTGNLVKALRSSEVRGRWGEMQLKRAVEMAGMVEYCDFEQQASMDGDAGRQQPDLVIRLPNGRNLVVDAKTPLKAYMEAMESQDETEKTAKLREHAHQVRQHVKQLAAKKYSAQFQPAPEFVFLWLPAESIYRAALEHDPALIEVGAEDRILIASPTTLIALLWTVAHVWREERMARNAQEISELGKSLYDRLRTLTDHLAGVGRGLGQAMGAYNSAVGSLESRVLVAARKFKELGAATGEELEGPPKLDQPPRALPDLDGDVGERTPQG